MVKFIVKELRLAKAHLPEEERRVWLAPCFSKSLHLIKEIGICAQLLSGAVSVTA